jgi:hypothetical protein
MGLGYVDLLNVDLLSIDLLTPMILGKGLKPLVFVDFWVF